MDLIAGGLPGPWEMRGANIRAVAPLPPLVLIGGRQRLKRFLVPTCRVAEFS